MVSFTTQSQSDDARVVRQLEGERNFHVFYQLLRGLPDSQCARYGLTKPQDFHYMNQSAAVDIPGMRELHLDVLDHGNRRF